MGLARHFAIALAITGLLLVVLVPLLRKEWAPFSAEDLESILADQGYEYLIDEDGKFIWNIDDYEALVFVEENQSVLRFHTGFAKSGSNLEHINAWNRDTVLSSSYVDLEGNSILELDLDLRGGVTEQRVINFLNTSKESFRLWIDAVIF